MSRGIPYVLPWTIVIGLGYDSTLLLITASWGCETSFQMTMFFIIRALFINAVHEVELTVLYQISILTLDELKMYGLD